jgi:hypothetical protein
MRVSQKPYEGKLQKKAKMLEEDKDLEEMEEEEGTDWEMGEGTPAQNKGTQEDKNTKILSKKISDQNQNQWLVYKYDKSDMGLFKVHIRPDDSDPKNNTSVVDIRRLLERLHIEYCRIFQDSRRHWTVLFCSRNMANSLVNCTENKENKLEAFILARVVVKKRIIGGISLDINTGELLERIRTENPSLHVTGAKRNSRSEVKAKA